MIRARLLGFERETVVDNWMLPSIEGVLKRPRLRRLSINRAIREDTDPGAIEIDYEVYELERVLSIDDGGPLAIYGRVR